MLKRYQIILSGVASLILAGTAAGQSKYPRRPDPGEPPVPGCYLIDNGTAWSCPDTSQWVGAGGTAQPAPAASETSYDSYQACGSNGIPCEYRTEEVYDPETGTTIVRTIQLPPQSAPSYASQSGYVPQYVPPPRLYIDTSGFTGGVGVDIGGATILSGVALVSTASPP